MAIQSLRELYLDELRDLYSAEQQIVEALPSLVAGASSTELKRAFEEHLEQTRVQRERLDLIFAQLNEHSQGQTCEGMEGLLKEGRQFLEAQMPSEVKDAALIAAAQRVEHYEIAGYGTARTFARLLGDWESERLLDQTLQEEGDADHRLTHIAESGINQAAGRSDDTLYNQRWARLRFIDVNDLDRRQIDYTQVHLRSAAGDDLGTLDGFVVEGTSGRPFYYVVDSGGWFMGRRYLVPIGKGQFDAQTRALEIDIDKDALKRFPEFSTAAFVAMSDADARRYERRILSTVNPQAGASPRYWEAYDTLPEYRPPTWVQPSAWTRAGTAAAASTPAAPRPLPSDTRPGAAPAASRTRDTANRDLVTARAANTEPAPGSTIPSTGVRGINEGEPAAPRPERLDDDDQAR